MDNAYRCAVITVILTFGVDSQAGMPGVHGYSSDVFSSHVFEHVEDLKLITGLPPLSDQMDNLRWGERDWTFQEGLLSTQRLISGGCEPIFDLDTIRE